MVKKKTENLGNFIPTAKKVGIRIQEARKKFNIKQEDLAKILGYKTNTPISLMESGEKNPSLETLYRLAEAIPVDLHLLVTGNSSPVSKWMIDRYINLAEKFALRICGEQQFLMQFLNKISELTTRQLPPGDRLEIVKMATHRLCECDIIYQNIRGGIHLMEKLRSDEILTKEDILKIFPNIQIQ